MMGELIMKLLHARTTAHVLHLKATSYAKHVALNEFYDGIIPLVDSLAEAYQGDYGVIQNYPPRYTPIDDPVELVATVSKWVEEHRYECCDSDDTYLQNIIDEIIALNPLGIYKKIVQDNEET